MSARLLPAAAAALAASWLVAGSLRADVPSQEHPKTCDLESSSAVAGPCLECEADYLDARACDRSLSPKGLTRHCRTGGILQWTEVWCGPAAAPAPKVSASVASPPAAAAPPPASAAPAPSGPPASDGPAPRPSSCAMSASSGATGSLAWVVAWALALALRARRSRPH